MTDKIRTIHLKKSVSEKFELVEIIEVKESELATIPGMMPDWRPEAVIRKDSFIYVYDGINWDYKYYSYLRAKIVDVVSKTDDEICNEYS